mmetsp:Transcript_60780/g.142208  ORF Transcript_60780/g.142208 Transcript_60780/m.142208 type:complete len:179 (+) Transcript_60780:37-573(+)
MGHASCALGCSDQRECSAWGTSRTHVVEVEVPGRSAPRCQTEAPCLESWHGTSAAVPVMPDVKPRRIDAASHLSPLPALQLDMPAAVAAAFLESTRAEADAKYRRKLACRAARAEAAGQTSSSTAEAATVHPEATPIAAGQHRNFNLDGKFVSSGAIRQRLLEMEATSFGPPAPPRQS